jgi:predicted DNA-binding protein YlxM (UPF0122 family)
VGSPPISHDEHIASIAGAAAAKVIAEILERKIREAAERRISKRLYDVRTLMKNYRSIKADAGNGVAYLSDTLQEFRKEDFAFFKSLMENREVNVAAITESKARSAIILSHIDHALELFRLASEASGKSDDARHYRVLYAKYVDPAQPSDAEIAQRENIVERTVYKDIDAACEKLGVFMFGVQFIERV